jgi:argininosuccinate synthase
MSDVKKVVLAYSGGLDTSVILKWLQDTYQCEVVTFTADLGQGEELEPARAKALQFGIKPENIFIDDLREEFVRDFVFPMFRANTIYEGEYLLGTSIARPLIAKRQIEIARATGADAVSHGATGKGNDQVRFELGYYALMPNVKVIAPWREWDLLSREKLLAYAEKNGIPIEMKHKQGGSPYSMDANLLHISFEGRHLEPGRRGRGVHVALDGFPRGRPRCRRVRRPGVREGRSGCHQRHPHEGPRAARQAQRAGRQARHRPPRSGRKPLRGHEVPRLLRNPGGTILLRAHRAIESITLDREVAHLKDDLMPRYASMIYTGYWWSPERLACRP